MATPGKIDCYALLTVGQSATQTRTVTEADLVLFAVATGDLNPVHLDAARAAASSFGGRIAHGMLTAGYVSAVLAMELPGAGSVYLSQSLRFVRPVRIGDVIRTRVEIVELLTAKRRIRLSTQCRNSAEALVLDGEAVVLLPEEG